MKKPIIGVTPLVDIQRESYWLVPGYMKGIEVSGGIPIMLPLTCNKADIDALINMCDGFLFTGGQDISPSLYREERSSLCGEVCKERDTMEKILFEIVLSAGHRFLREGTDPQTEWLHFHRTTAPRRNCCV